MRPAEPEPEPDYCEVCNQPYTDGDSEEDRCADCRNGIPGGFTPPEVLDEIMLPPCVRAMRCYCAGHANGLDVGEPCDTNEENYR